MKNKWEQDEEIKLKEIFPYKSTEELVLIMGRSKASIIHKAYRLKLKKNKEAEFIHRHNANTKDNNPTWKGGKKTRLGYVLILVGENRYMQEHRAIMSDYLGRSLTINEVVHHINGIKSDNRIENLRLMTNSEHTTLHNTGTKNSELVKLHMSIAAKNRKRKRMAI